MMLDHGDVASIEHHVRELTDNAVEAARERAALGNAVKAAAAELEAAERALPIAERTAKERRQAQNDAIRGRAELEQRLAEIIEAEDLTRARRQQAEQRAQGFRAAAAFAATGRSEAENSGDTERAERERLVEDRAAREAANAEARATEELAEETKLGRHRAEIETHVEAERALESSIAADRAAAEAHVVELRETIERVSFALHEAQVNLARLDADRDRLAEERAAAGQQLREIGARARGEIEARIADLRAQEAELARERAEQERLLAALLENERTLEIEPEPAVEAEPEPEAAPEPVLAETVQAHAPPQDAAPGEDSTAPVGAVAAADAEPATSAEPPSANGHFSTVTFTASPSAPREPASQSLIGFDPADDERGAGFRSIIGNIFTRKKADEPVVDEGPSIADRIARDFGLLGESDESETGAAGEAVAPEGPGA